MHAQDPLLALLLFLELDPTGAKALLAFVCVAKINDLGVLSSRPLGVASSSSTSSLPSQPLNSVDPLSPNADSAIRRLTETRKGSSMLLIDQSEIFNFSFLLILNSSLYH